MRSVARLCQQPKRTWYETALVRAAQARGLRASGGLAMLLYQGAEAFRLSTGRAAPLDAMHAALE